jgi:hypothetical protein
MIRRLLLWFNVRRLVVAILFVALFAMAVRVPVDTDTWWHLAAGRVTLESGKILRTDLFSHTRYGSDWVNHSWLSQVILYWLFEHFSYAGLGLWMGAVVTVAFAFVYLQMEGDPFARGIILILAAATSSVIWVARPQLFSFLLTAIVAYVLYLFKWRKINRLWLLPPVFLVWVNLHAGYALGFMVMAAFVIGEVFNRVWHVLGGAREDSEGADGDTPLLSWRDIGMIIGVALLSVLILVVNPYTTRMWVYYLDTVGIGALQDFIQEWQSPDFHPLHTHPFIWLLLGCLSVMGLSGRRADGTDLAMVGMFAYASLLAGRNFGPFALIVAPVLSRHTSAMLARWSKAGGWKLFSRRSTRPLMGLLNLVLLLLVVGLAVLKVWTPLTAEFNEQEQRKSLPVDAAAWVLANRPEGEMFNSYNWGGYLIWALYPHYGVFVDGRTDLYGDEFLREYLRAQLGKPGFEETLSKYDINLVITYPDDALSVQLDCAGSWRNAYEDEVAVVWVRETAH